MDCIFCKIIKGDIPSYTLYEDDLVKVFLDIDPKENGHTLIQTSFLYDICNRYKISSDKIIY